MFFKLIKINRGLNAYITLGNIADYCFNLRDCKKSLPYYTYIAIYTTYDLLKKHTKEYLMNQEIFIKTTLYLKELVSLNIGVTLSLDGFVSQFDRQKNDLANAPFNIYNEIQTFIEELTNDQTILNDESEFLDDLDFENNSNLDDSEEETAESIIEKQKSQVPENNFFPNFTNKKKSRKNKIFIILTIVCLCIIATLALCFPQKENSTPQKENYYYSEEFTSLTSREKLITILKREGECGLNDDLNSYEMIKEYTKDEFDYRFTLFYYSPDDELGFEFTSQKEYIEYTTSIFFTPGTVTHTIWTKTMRNNNLIALGNLQLYAPTYKDSSLHFEEYYGDVPKSSMEILLSNAVSMMLSTLQNMVKDYNFSVSYLGFNRYS